jgi:biotin carboxyl carrier protein
MKRYRITLGNRVFDVRVIDDPRRDRVRVEVDGEVFTVGVGAVPQEVPAAEAVAPAPADSGTSQPEAGPAATAGGNVVQAPLPGVIKSIAVRRGQQVASNDELLVIEAMKMDNVIRAPRAATVGTIHVAEGRQVAYGEPLLDLD